MAPRTKSIQELRRELAAKETQLNELVAKRASLAAKLEQLDRQIETVRGASPETASRPGRKPGVKAAAAAAPKAAAKPGKKARGRATGTPLVDYVKKVLAEKGDAMRAKDVMTAVKKAGYKTESKDFYGIVATTLRDAAGVKRVGRGVYTLAK